MTMTAPELLDLADQIGDTRISAAGLLLAIRGAALDRAEKDALAAMACSLEDRLTALVDEIESIRAVEAKPESKPMTATATGYSGHGWYVWSHRPDVAERYFVCPAPAEREFPDERLAFWAEGDSEPVAILKRKFAEPYLTKIEEGGE